MLLSGGLDKGNLIDLFQRGDARAHSVQCGFTQEAHALFAGGSPDLGSWLPFQYHLANAVAQIEQFVNRRTSTVTSTGALDTSLAFVERHCTPLLEIQSAGFQNVGWIVNRTTTGIADHAHQSLCQNAVQSGDKVIGFDAHVQEATYNVDDVVGMDSGEHQMSGQGSIDSDLCRLHVADFADHDLVGIVPQDRSQSAGECQSLFLIDRNLRNTPKLVFDRILDGNQFVFVGFDLIYRRI